MTFKSGFVTLIGRPNVGKSTLLNLLAGEKISIISDKPQTTRNSIKTVVTTEDSQMVFIDTPGIHKPKNKLGEFMVSAARETFSEVDVVLFLVEATSTTPGAGDLFIVEQLKNLKTSVFLIINKIDLVSKEQLLPIISKYKELMDFDAIIPVSAAKNDGVELLVEQLKKHLPEGPKYFPDDMLTDQPMKLIAAEFIREKILRLTKDEVPHGVGIEILQFIERTEKEIVDIRAVIYCE
ncbi:MAG TPA: GTPase Era, partial [Clostridia bacterium]